MTCAIIYMVKILQKLIMYLIVWILNLDFCAISVAENAGRRAYDCSGEPLIYFRASLRPLHAVIANNDTMLSMHVVDSVARSTFYPTIFFLYIDFTHPPTINDVACIRLFLTTSIEQSWWSTNYLIIHSSLSSYLDDQMYYLQDSSMHLTTNCLWFD